MPVRICMWSTETDINVIQHNDTLSSKKIVLTIHRTLHIIIDISSICMHVVVEIFWLAKLWCRALTRWYYKKPMGHLCLGQA